MTKKTTRRRTPAAAELAEARGKLIDVLKAKPSDAAGPNAGLDGLPDFMHGDHAMFRYFEMWRGMKLRELAAGVTAPAMDEDELSGLQEDICGLAELIARCPAESMPALVVKLHVLAIAAGQETGAAEADPVLHSLWHDAVRWRPRCARYLRPEDFATLDAAFEANEGPLPPRLEIGDGTIPVSRRQAAGVDGDGVAGKGAIGDAPSAMRHLFDAWAGLRHRARAASSPAEQTELWRAAGAIAVAIADGGGGVNIKDAMIGAAVVLQHMQDPYPHQYAAEDYLKGMIENFGAAVPEID